MPHLIQVDVIARIGQIQLVLLLLGHAGQHAVEDVVVSFVASLEDRVNSPGKETIDDLPERRCATSPRGTVRFSPLRWRRVYRSEYRCICRTETSCHSELSSHCQRLERHAENAIATSIRRLSPTFENRIGVENLLLDPRVLPAGRCQELQNQLGRFSLATAALATDDDALIVLVALHAPVGIVADGEDVRREFADLLVRVPTDVISIVDVEQLVRIDGDEDRAREGLKRRASRATDTRQPALFT